MINGKRVSVLVAFVCNPYLAVLFKRMYLKYWKDEIDELLVNVNGRNHTIRKFIVDLYKDDDKVVVIDEVKGEIRQGHAFDNMYHKSTGEILITMDSDNFIFKKGVIEENCKKLEEFDSIGSFGFHAYPGQVGDICVQKYGTARLNPFMAFFKSVIIDQMTEVSFETKSFKKEDYFEYLGTMEYDGWFDVMTPFCLKYFNIANNKFKIPESQDGEYHHFSCVSSLYRRCFTSLEDTDTQIYTKTGNVKQNLNNWRNYYILYELTKDEVPFKEYNEQFELGFNYELEKADLKIEQVKIQLELFKKNNEGMFI